MWPLPPVHDTLTVFSFYQDAIIGAWIVPSKKNSAFELKAYCKIKRYHPVLICSEIIQEIKQFLKVYHLQNSFTAFCIHTSDMKQTFFSSAHSSYDSYKQEHTENKKISFCSYLYPTEHGRFVFYSCSLLPQDLFLYQLFAQMIQVQLTTITPSFQSLLAVYRFMYGDSFRQIQLAVDMQRTQHNLQMLYTPEIVHRIIDTKKQSFSLQDPSLLPSALGTYLLEQGYHG